MYSHAAEDFTPLEALAKSLAELLSVLPPEPLDSHRHGIKDGQRR